MGRENFKAKNRPGGGRFSSRGQGGGTGGYDPEGWGKDQCCRMGWKWCCHSGKPIFRSGGSTGGMRRGGTRGGGSGRAGMNPRGGKKRYSRLNESKFRGIFNNSPQMQAEARAMGWNPNDNDQVMWWQIYCIFCCVLASCCDDCDCGLDCFSEGDAAAK